jgi:hypothetical protein
MVAHCVADIVEADGVGELGEEQRDDMTPRGKGARLFVDAVLLGEAGGEVGRDQLAKLGEDGQVSSPIAKFFSDDAFAALVKAVGLHNGDLAFFGAGPYSTVSDFMGAVRLKVGKDLGLVQDAWKPLWVTDFPMSARSSSGSMMNRGMCVFVCVHACACVEIAVS